MRAVLFAAMALAGAAALADDTPIPPAASASGKTAPMSPEQRAELTKAIEATKMLLQYKEGKITLTPEQVREYRATLRAYVAAHGKARKGPPPKLILRDMPLRVLAMGYRAYSGKPVIITDRAGAKLVTLDATAATASDLVAQIDAALHEQGFVVNHTDAGTTIDLP